MSPLFGVSGIHVSGRHRAGLISNTRKDILNKTWPQPCSEAVLDIIAALVALVVVLVVEMAVIISQIIWPMRVYCNNLHPLYPLH